MKEKMTYEIPEAEIVVLSTTDVLTGSENDNIGLWSFGDWGYDRDVTK